MGLDKGKARKSLSTDKRLDRIANTITGSDWSMGPDKAYATSLRTKARKANISRENSAALIKRANAVDPPSLKGK